MNVEPSNKGRRWRTRPSPPRLSPDTEQIGLKISIQQVADVCQEYRKLVVRVEA